MIIFFCTALVLASLHFFSFAQPVLLRKIVSVGWTWEWWGIVMFRFTACASRQCINVQLGIICWRICEFDIWCIELAICWFPVFSKKIKFGWSAQEQERYHIIGWSAWRMETLLAHTFALWKKYIVGLGFERSLCHVRLWMCACFFQVETRVQRSASEEEMLMYEYTCETLHELWCYAGALQVARVFFPCVFVCYAKMKNKKKCLELLSERAFSGCTTCS